MCNVTTTNRAEKQRGKIKNNAYSFAVKYTGARADCIHCLALCPFMLSDFGIHLKSVW